MLVVLVLAAVAVIAGVTVVAMGRGGELTEFAPDVPPLDLPTAGRLSAVDFMGLQLPVSLVGYHTQSVDEALNRVANALSERDTRIAVLEQRISELLSSRLQARQELHVDPSGGLRTESEHEYQDVGPSDGPPTESEHEDGADGSELEHGFEHEHQHENTGELAELPESPSEPLPESPSEPLPDSVGVRNDDRSKVEDPR